MNSTDKEDEEGGKPKQRNGAVHAAGVTGERSEERSSAKSLWLFSVGPPAGDASSVKAFLENNPTTGKGSDL